MSGETEVIVPFTIVPVVKSDHASQEQVNVCFDIEACLRNSREDALATELLSPENNATSVSSQEGNMSFTDHS
jgi:hypothetical protein